MSWTSYPVEEQIRIIEFFSLFCPHYDKGYYFSGETHDFWECVYIIKGEVCVSGDERVYNLSDGEIIFHKPMELHKFVVNSDDGCDLLIFSFSAVGPLTLFLRDKVFRLSVSQKDLMQTFLSYLYSHQRNASVAEYKYFTLSPEDFSEYSQMFATYLCQLMLSLYEQGTVSTASQAQDALTFRKAINYLNRNIHRQPTVLEIARYCSVSEASIKRIFDKYADIGVHKYLLKLKIKTAAELLRDGLSVSQVADELGFTSQSYFSKAFKRETGHSPSDLK